MEGLLTSGSACVSRLALLIASASGCLKFGKATYKCLGFARDILTLGDHFV